MIENYRHVNRVTCARCGSSVEPRETIYDDAANLVCRKCHGALESAKANQAIGDARVRSGGLFGGAYSPMSQGRMVWLAFVIALAVVKMCIIASR